MQLALTFIFAVILSLPLAAQEIVAAESSDIDAPGTVDAVPVVTPLNAADLSLDTFLWTQRPIVIFADTTADPRFQKQLSLLLDRPDALLDRDVVLIIDTDPQAQSEIRRKLRPRGFMLTLIGKDGGVKLRKPFPWDVREITHAIDKWPLRKQEIRDRTADTQ